MIFTQDFGARGQTSNESSSQSSQTFSYDGDDRLTGEQSDRAESGAHKTESSE